MQCVYMRMCQGLRVTRSGRTLPGMPEALAVVLSHRTRMCQDFRRFEEVGGIKGAKDCQLVT